MMKEEIKSVLETPHKYAATYIMLSNRKGQWTIFVSLWEADLFLCSYDFLLSLQLIMKSHKYYISRDNQDHIMQLILFYEVAYC